MPTINQLIRKGREQSENVSKSPALNRGYNSIKKRPTNLSALRNAVFVHVSEQ